MSKYTGDQVVAWAETNLGYKLMDWQKEFLRAAYDKDGNHRNLFIHRNGRGGRTTVRQVIERFEVAMSNKVRFIVVTEHLLDPDQIETQLPEVLEAIDAPRLPHFGNQIRVALDQPDGDQIATKVLDFLDEPKGSLS